MSTSTDAIVDTTDQPAIRPKVEPNTELIRVAELSWAAGFIDGEGCIGAVRQRYKCKTKRSYYIRLRLGVSQNDLATLQRLQKILGVPSVIAQLKWFPSQTRPIYVYQVDGRHVIRALEQIEPFLVRKRHQARTCFEFWQEGKMGIRTGPKGISDEIWNIREYYLKRLTRMK